MLPRLHFQPAWTGIVGGMQEPVARGLCSLTYLTDLMIVEEEKAIDQSTDQADHLLGVSTVADVHHPEIALAPVRTPGYQLIEDMDDSGVARLQIIGAVLELLPSRAEAMGLAPTAEGGPLHDDFRRAETTGSDLRHLGDLVLLKVRQDHAIPPKVVAARRERGRGRQEVKFTE